MTKYHKPSEVAKQLRVSTETIRNLCRNGQLHHVRIGGDRGAIRIPADALEAYLNRAQPAQAELPAIKYSNLPGLNY